MDRRQLLKNLTLSSSKKEDGSMALPVAGGLDKYVGPWNYANAAHLLRRAMFGPTHEQIKQAVADGLDKTIEKLLIPSPEPTKPLHYTDIVDPFVKKGETWVDKSFTIGVVGLNQARDNSLFSWMLQNIFNEGVSITEKMILFWHNHFVVSEIFLANISYSYLTTIRKNVIGDFKQLTKDITIDGAMLIYLNGNSNTRRAPNENYARELLELFTLGKGELAGPGDYTTYTENDILQIAKVLTGWTTPQGRKQEVSPIDNMTYNTNSPSVMFVPTLHSTETKTLSKRFNEEPITNNGDKEYQNLIDIIFKKREAATFICRKLYRYFVYYKIDNNIENEIVEGLADTLISNSFKIDSVVKQLLSSQHFYSQEAYGALIRSPYDWFFNTVKALKMIMPTNSDPIKQIETQYGLFLSAYRILLGQSQGVFDLPSVAGWPAYYQEPAYHEIWINSVSYPMRYNLGTQLINKRFGSRQGGTIYGVEVADYVAGFDDPGNARKLIDDIVAHLLPQAITQAQKDFLLSRLINNSSEAQWKTRWDAYKADPRTQNKTVVENQLRPMFISLLSMPEYQLS